MHGIPVALAPSKGSWTPRPQFAVAPSTAPPAPVPFQTRPQGAARPRNPRPATCGPVTTAPRAKRGAAAAAVHAHVPGPPPSSSALTAPAASAWGPGRRAFLRGHGAPRPPPPSAPDCCRCRCRGAASCCCCGGGAPLPRRRCCCCCCCSEGGTECGRRGVVPSVARMAAAPTVASTALLAAAALEEEATFGPAAAAAAAAAATSDNTHPQARFIRRGGDSDDELRSPLETPSCTPPQPAPLLDLSTGAALGGAPAAAAAPVLDSPAFRASSAAYARRGEGEDSIPMEESVSEPTGSRRSARRRSHPDSNQNGGNAGGGSDSCNNPESSSARRGGGGGGGGSAASWPPSGDRLAAVAERLRALPREDFPPVAARAAAVLVGLFEDSSGLVRVLLTQRSAKLKSHRGEVCLPGGKRDEDDGDDVATALREAQEELGLDPGRVTVLCSLPPVLSKHHLSVTPVLALLPPDLVPRPNPNEVAAAFTVPLAVFLGQSTDPRAGACSPAGGGGKATGRRTRQRIRQTADETPQRPMALSWLAEEEEEGGGVAAAVTAAGVLATAAEEEGQGVGAGGGEVRGAGRCIGEDVAYEDVEHVVRDIPWGEHKYRIHSFQYGEYDVWGLTATICIDAARLALGRGPSFQERCPGGHHYSAFFWDGAVLRIRPCASTAPRALLTAGAAATPAAPPAAADAKEETVEEMVGEVAAMAAGSDGGFEEVTRESRGADGLLGEEAREGGQRTDCGDNCV